MLTADLAGTVVDLTRQLVAFDSVNPGLVPGGVGVDGMAEPFTARIDGGRMSGRGSAARCRERPPRHCCRRSATWLTL